MTTVGVVGGGVVGGATAQCWESVKVYDLDTSRCRNSLSDVLSSDIIFICLPTPQVNGLLTCDLSAIEEFCSIVRGGNSNLVLKSTVPIGTTKMLRSKYKLEGLVHSPEFLTARTAVEDAKNPTRLIVGGEICACRTTLAKLYDATWPDVDKYLMTSNESEAVKLFQNAFSAIKIAAFNEFRTLTDAKGMCWGTVRTALLGGGWINEQHTNVPGPDGKRGYGGACLTKDIANLVSCLRDAGLDDSVSFAAHTRNKKDRES